MAESDKRLKNAGAQDVMIRKGERIPRRNAPQFEEANNFIHAIKRDGFFGTAMDDKNQYGPLSMMILLLIIATITGLILKLFS